MMIDKEAKKQALEHFNICPLNMSVTKETAHQAKELRAWQESTTRLLHIQTKRMANYKTMLKDTALNAGPKTLTNKYAASKTPSKAVAKATNIGEGPCPQKQMGSGWRSSANEATTLAKAKNLAAAHFHERICDPRGGRG